MKKLLDAGIDNVFLWINPVEKCIRYFPRCYVNRVRVTYLMENVVCLQTSKPNDAFQFWISWLLGPMGAPVWSRLESTMLERGHLWPTRIPDPVWRPCTITQTTSAPQVSSTWGLGGRFIRNVIGQSGWRQNVNTEHVKSKSRQVNVNNGTITRTNMVAMSRDDNAGIQAMFSTIKCVFNFDLWVDQLQLVPECTSPV
jgi:hypothetical protein